MKRIGIALLLFLVAFSLFAAPKPSIEGRASVAEENVFPTGLFAKAIGFLPGDSVTVTNPVSGISVNVLILGTPEKDGIAILLSPEAASRLFITKDSNALVSVTKRIAQPKTTADPNPSVIEPIEIPPELEEKLRNQQNQASAESDQENPTATVKPNNVNTGYGPDVRMSGENPSETASPPGTSSNTLLIPPDSNVRVVTSDPDSSQNTTPDKNIESPRETVRITGAAAAQQPTESAAPNAIKTPRETVRVTGTDTAQQPIESAAPNAIKTPRETVRVTGAAAATQPIENTAPNAIRTPSETVRVTGAGTAPTESTGVIPFQTPSESVKVTEGALKKIENPVIGTVRLMPAPPVKPPDTTQDDEGIALDPPPVSPPPSENKLANYTVDAAKLRGGSYYIQIATMSSEKNINGVLSDYGDKYPIALVPSPTSTAYQVLIGPLGLDEYGAVLERFKDNGYKDAFARKIR